MRPILEDIPQQQSVLVFQQSVSSSSSNWHFHPEIEIALVLEGHGQALIGDWVSNFERAQLYLIGENLAHDFISHEDHTARFLVLQFNGLLLNAFPELQQLNTLLNEAKQGLLFEQLSEQHMMNWQQLLDKPESERGLYCLLCINNLLHVPKKSLQQQEKAIQRTDRHQKRLQRVLDYIAANLAEPISSSQTAKICSMSGPAFSRWFKHTLNVTFSEYLRRRRIEKAVDLLQNSELAINQVAEQVGFQSLSHFNRSFQQLKGCTPMSVRKKMR